MMSSLGLSTQRHSGGTVENYPAPHTQGGAPFYRGWAHFAHGLLVSEPKPDLEGLEGADKNRALA